MARRSKNTAQQKSVDIPFAAAEVARRMLAWYGTFGRDLPWRHTRDPYRIWLSEIMLQQTTVAAVIPYYERFLERFPSLVALASAPLDDVISLWAGLGYYSRARNLHRAAVQVVEEFDGSFPDTLQDLLSLPGIGRSTAGAILSIAFDRPAPILDGNVRRVLVRLFAWQEDQRSSAAEKQLWAWAEALAPEGRPHDYAQAIMDLGATVCTPRQPGCKDCPLHDLCLAKQKGLAGRLPVSRKKKSVPLRRQVAVVVRSGGSLLVRQRPAEGFLGGMFELPAMDWSEALDQRRAAQQLLADLGLRGEVNQAALVRHAYSHFKLEVTVFSVNVDDIEIVAEGSGFGWVTAEQIDNLPVHGAHKKAYGKVLSSP